MFVRNKLIFKGDKKMSEALKGIVVLDLGQVYNGSYCSMLMAFNGAEVIKIEPLDGEPLRKRSREGKEAYEFMMLNSNKLGMTLNLKSKKGKKIFLKMLEKADVVIENFSMGVMKKLGLNYETLSKINPRIVYGSGKGYGIDGPYANLPAMDLTVQAMSGVMSVTGFPDSTPLKAGAAFSDFMGGIHLYSGIMTALYQREKTGKGQFVDISMHDSTYPAMSSPLGAFYDSEGNLPERTGNRHSGLAYTPYNVYPTEDGHIALFCVTDNHWENLTNGINNVGLFSNLDLSTNDKRVEHMDFVDERIAEWTKTQKREELFEKLLQWHVPCAPVLTVSEVSEDPQLQHRGMIQTINHPTEGVVKVIGNPLQLSDSPTIEFKPSPLLGEHTEDILKRFADLDMSEISNLRDEGVIK